MGTGSVCGGGGGGLRMIPCGGSLSYNCVLDNLMCNNRALSYGSNCGICTLVHVDATLSDVTKVWKPYKKQY